MNNFISMAVSALLLAGALFSCAATPPAGSPLAAEESDAVIGTVSVEFRAPVGSSNEVINVMAYDRLLARARMLFGDNVDVRDIEATRAAAAFGMAMMIGGDMTIAARGTVISLDIQAARARAGTTEHALGEVRRVLPAGARVWVHNNATADRGLASDVVDDMTSAFIRDSITVVERGLVDLIAIEQGIHLDGTVADSDFISIGNAAGANIIVVVNISGAGAARRLSVRVLDIALGTVRMQSDTGEAWRL